MNSPSTMGRSNMLERTKKPLDIIVDVLGLDLTGLPDWVPDAIVHGTDGSPASPREWVESVARALFVDGLLTEAQISQSILCPELGLGKLVGTLPDAKQFVTDTIKKLLQDSGRTYKLLERRDWKTAAEEFARDTRPMMPHYNGDFYERTNGAYHPVEEVALEADVRDFLSRAKCRVFNKKNKRWDVEPFNPNMHDIAELIDALRHIRHRARDKYAPPCWFDDDHADMPAYECISFPNGILHLPTGKFIEATPAYFTLNAVEFDYDAKATCPLWVETLGQWWPEKGKEAALLQELFGYLVSTETWAQKIPFMLGVPRSGKGVTSRVLVKLIGKANTTSTSLHSLGGEFGRQALIGKQLALIAETKLSRKDNEGAITGYLLSISGEDSQSINRKNKDFWEGKLSVRFLWLGNKMPTFADDGTALGNRLIILRMTNSFLGKEDYALEGKLHAELPGIMNWAINGWKSLKKRRHFEETDAGNEAKEDFIRLASPTLSFVEDLCEFVDSGDVGKEELYSAFKAWCRDQNRYAESAAQFSENLMACGKGRVASFRPKVNGDGEADAKRPRKWRGIKLKIPF